MAYCTSCGAPLAGAQKFCASCGYKVPSGKAAEPDPELDRTSQVGYTAVAEEEVEVAREEPEPEPEPEPPAPPAPEERPDHLREEEPIRRGFIPSCDVCGNDGESACIFCEKGLCGEHSKKMAVMVNGIASSRTVAACDGCSKDKVGTVPTAPAARAADFLYAIKPYHEWGFTD